MAPHTAKPRRYGLWLLLVFIIVGAFFYANGHHRASSHTATTISSSKTVSPDSKLQSIIQTWSAAQPYSTAVSVHDVEDSLHTAGINQNKQVVTASVYKLFVAYGVLHQIEQGEQSLTTSLSSGQTVQTALTAMITKSDNDSAEALGFKVGWPTINSLAAAIGATHTNIDNYDSSGNYTSAQKVTTANDVDLLLTKLQAGKLLNSSNTTLLLGLMKQQVWRERIPAGIPSSISVADKPGWLSPADGYNGYIENDAAIIYGPKSTYILVVMTSSSTTQPLANLSQQLYTELEK